MFSTNLRTLRKANGYSQEELATRLNVVRQTVSKWEKGLSVPDADLLINIAEIFEVSVSELLGDNIEVKHEQDDVAGQLSRINEQLALINRRTRRTWKAAAVTVGVAVIITATALITSHFTRTAVNNNDYRTDEVTAYLPTEISVSSEDARRIYNVETANNLRNSLLQSPRINEVFVVIDHGDANPFQLKTDENKPTASIQVDLNGADKLSAEEARTIADMVKGAVPGIEYESIAITDTNFYVYPVSGDTAADGVNTTE